MFIYLEKALFFCRLKAGFIVIYLIDYCLRDLVSRFHSIISDWWCSSFSHPIWD